MCQDHDLCLAYKNALPNHAVIILIQRGRSRPSLPPQYGQCPIFTGVTLSDNGRSHDVYLEGDYYILLWLLNTVLLFPLIPFSSYAYF